MAHSSNCRQCGKELDSYLTRCPHCGTKRRQSHWARNRRGLLIILVSLIAFFVILGIVMWLMGTINWVPKGSSDPY